MDTSTQKVKEFWKEMADTHKESQLATAPDHYYRDLEIKRIAEYLEDNVTVLDVGCGNGYSTVRFARQYPNATFVGVDYSEEMIEYANEILKKEDQSVQDRVKFVVGDVLKLAEAVQDQKFDYVVSERCIINLQNWEEQQHAILEMKKTLTPEGKIILCENTFDGLQRVNELRKIFDLHAIEVRWHNCYLPEKELEKFLEDNFAMLDRVNIGSLYYIISRVVYAALAKEEGKELDYNHPLNKIASQLPSLGEYSANYIYLIKNK